MTISLLELLNLLIFASETPQNEGYLNIPRVVCNSTCTFRRTRIQHHAH